MTDHPISPAAPSTPLRGGRVGEDQLRQLLLQGAEGPELDFKVSLDLGNAASRLDFVKDCAAMMNQPQGGYIVIGANDDGTPYVGDLPAPTKEMFDSAILIQKVQAYIDTHVNIEAQIHQITIKDQQWTMAIIYIAPPIDGIPAIMTQNGIDSSSQNPQGKFRFREGQVFTRKGSVNTLVTHTTWGNVLHNFRAIHRNEAREDVDALLHRVTQSLGAPGTPQLVRPDFDMDDQTFTETVRLLLSQNQPIKPLTLTAKSRYLGNKEPEVQENVVRKLSLIAIESITSKNTDAFKTAIGTLYDIYKTHLVESGSTLGVSGAPSAWLSIITHIEAIGAFAVRTGSYAEIPTIVLQRIGPSRYYFPSWIRHGQVEASRNELLNTSEGMKENGLIYRVVDLLRKHPSLRPDLERVSPETEELFLDSVCQFDFYYCCVAKVWCLANENSTGADFYPNGASFSQSRSMPAIDSIDSSAEIRSELFGQASDTDIATGTADVILLAANQSYNYGSWWLGLRSLDQFQWIDQHRDKEAPRTNF